MAQIAKGAKLQFGTSTLFLLNRDNFDGSDGTTTTVESTISYGVNGDRPDLQIDLSLLTLGAGAFSRLYLGRPEQRLRPFAHAEIGLVSSRTDYRSAFNEDFIGNNSWLTTRFGVGANLFLGPQVALEGTFSYSILREKRSNFN